MNEDIIKTEYSEIMQKSYIDYAMSVIVSRALGQEWNHGNRLD